MIRLYLDTNVLTALKKGDCNELKEWINENRNKLVIPFSSAHIKDKLPSENRAPEKFKDDISYLREITNDRYFNYDYTSNFVRNELAPPIEVLKAIKESVKELDYYSNFENIIKLLQDETMELELEEELSPLFEELDRLLSTKVERNDSDTSLKEVVQKSMEESQIIKNDYRVYSKMREELQSNIKIPSHISQMDIDSAIESINEIVKKNSEFVTFIEYIDSHLSEEYKSKLLVYFSVGYQLLSNLGYQSDVIGKNDNSFNNHLYDSLHSFYGAHCDYFVSYDNKLRFKSQFIYKLFNISTKVVTPEELMIELYSKVGQFKIEDIPKVMERTLPIDSLYEDGLVKSLYRLDSYYMNYFTHVQIERSQNGNVENMIFLKQYKNYANHFYFEEVRSIIENVLEFIGIKEFSEETYSEFHDGLEKNGFHYKNYILKKSMIYRLEMDIGESRFYIGFIDNKKNSKGRFLTSLLFPLTEIVRKFKNNRVA